jgi:hypothetical protein
MAARWNSLHREWLKIHADEMTDKECASILGRTIKAVKLKRNRTGIKKLMGRPKNGNNKFVTKINTYSFEF